MSEPSGDESGGARGACRYFASYSGVKLPLKLVNPIEVGGLANRNTFIRAWFDAAGALISLEKLVYGEVELSHRYEYHANGALRQAEIVMQDEPATVLRYDPSGALLPAAAEDA